MAEPVINEPTTEVKPVRRVDRIKNGIVEFVKNQMPAAHTERYIRAYDNIANRLEGNKHDIAVRLRPKMENAAKVAGVATTVGEIALVAASLYGGVLFLRNPTAAIAAAKAALTPVVAWGKGAAVATGAFVTETAQQVGESAVHAYDVTKEAAGQLFEKVRNIVDGILHRPGLAVPDPSKIPPIP